MHPTYVNVCAYACECICVYVYTYREILRFGASRTASSGHLEEAPPFVSEVYAPGVCSSWFGECNYLCRLGGIWWNEMSVYLRPTTYTTCGACSFPSVPRRSGTNHGVASSSVRVP